MKPDTKLLQFILGSGILDSGSVLNEFMATQREKVKKSHPYAITPPNGEKGRWQTWYVDRNGKRKNMKAQTENELLDKLVILYFSNSHIDKLTFHGLYEDMTDL